MLGYLPRLPRARNGSSGASAADSDGVFLVPGFVGLGAPYWDAYARGAILRLTRGTTAAHIARAALDSIAFQTRDLVLAMERDSGLELADLRVDGGAAMNDALMQFQADLLGTSVCRPVTHEMTALGAAYLAGLAVGYWQGQDDIARNGALDREFVPQLSADERDRLYRQWLKAVERSRDWQERRGPGGRRLAGVRRVR